MHVTTSQYEISAKKSHFPGYNKTLQGIIYPPETKLIGKSSILAGGESFVLPTDPPFTCEIDYIPMYPNDR